MSEKLKPCPFCDGEAELKQGFYVIDNYVECLKCGTRTAYYQTKARAIKRWNTRKPMDRIVERLKDIQMGEYSAKTEYVQGMNGNAAAYCDGAIDTIDKAIAIVKGEDDNENS